MNNRIYVLGQHRAGTTFIARCFAHDLKWHFYPEEVIEFSDAIRIAELQPPFVLQCPFLSSIAHTLDGHVIWCERDDAELIASQNRLYDADGYRLRWYYVEQGERERYNAINDPRSLAEIKRDCWRAQRARLPSWQEVNFNEFKTHEFYIADRENRNFRNVEQRIMPKPPRGNEIPLWLG